ncbi:MAG: hypothetical protein HPY73_05040 [Methanomassiliicoccales archaeon]|nr:MAG: hypothetical protein HPY73_05040 [Methanomassiliicoccales archaeon]
MRSIELNGCKVTVLPVIKGLVSEEKKVQEAFDAVMPDVVGISISKEELEGLSHKEEYEFIEPSYIEKVYQANLETFGEVRLPPPCYVRTMDLCAERGIRLIPLDMNEELFSETYCEKVGGIELLREAFFSSRVHRMRFDLSSPEKFVIDWDKRINKSRGLRELASLRERHMSDVIERLSKGCNKLLVVVELERSEGVLGLITE